MEIKTVFERKDDVSPHTVMESRLSLSKPKESIDGWLDISKMSTAGYEKSAGTKINKEEAIKLIEALKEVFELT